MFDERKEARWQQERRRTTAPTKAKYRYQVKNWAAYDRALVNRGNLTLWFDEGSVAKTWTPPRPVGRGKPGTSRTWRFKPA
jgi:hypothetical protein